MDNQLSDCTFKTALYQTSACKTSCVKSFLELAYTKTSVSNNLDVYKYVQLLLFLINYKSKILTKFLKLFKIF